MRLFRDLWSASPRRALVVVVLVALGAAGQAVGAAIAGPVLLYRSGVLFTLLAVALVLAVLSDLVISLLMARLTADWSARVRRQLCQVAFGQDLPTLEGTPVGELLDRIDSDVNQVASSVRGQGIRIGQGVAVAVLSVVISVFVWWPAGLAMVLVSAFVVWKLRKPAQKITPARMAEEEAWSDLAAVMEESIHGQDDVRTTLARPYVMRLFARRAKVVLERGRRVWRGTAEMTAIAAITTRVCIALVVLGG
ncbi:MAG: ABC transporter ATP-binding protein, partial [Hamadaea sp.]|nr:ABC transporter ATP-binding protein [Hamadaea sp.]